MTAAEFPGCKPWCDTHSDLGQVQICYLVLEQTNVVLIVAQVWASGHSYSWEKAPTVSVSGGGGRMELQTPKEIRTLADLMRSAGCNDRVFEHLYEGADRFEQILAEATGLEL